MNKTALHRVFLSLALTAMVLAISSCNETAKLKGKSKMDITKAPFGKTPAGESVDIYTLTNANGLEARIMTFGGACVSLKVPDRDGALGDILLGHDSLEGYLSHDTCPYFGALIGRYGNRIGKGRFSIDGKDCQVTVNDGVNHLHGGTNGFDHKVWAAEPVKKANSVGLKLTLTSPDGEEGYPGTLKATVVYTLTNDNELKIDYTATTDKPTVCNLTNHNYYNFTGCQSDILRHELTINADQITPVVEGLITTGEFKAVAGGPFDFRTPKAISKDINADDDQIAFGPGYDHNFVLNKAKPGEMTKAAEVYESTTGRVMEIWTTEPGIQFYSGNFLSGIHGKDGKVYNKHYGFCLETQHYPDSPNKPDWPTTVLRPGQTYKTSTVHKFSTR